MIILVINAGSTSFKCRLYDMASETELARGSVERIGEPDSEISCSLLGRIVVGKERRKISSHAEAASVITGLICSPATIASLDEIDGIGFKTVQAGERNGTVLLDEEVIEAMERYAPIAPAHNPPYLDCIRFFRALLPGKPLIGVFEPGFHTEIPEYARIFGAPYDWYTDYGVAKYGYHGATFRYVTQRAIESLDLDASTARIIACHLGGSSSVCAFAGGRSVDVSMTFTPQSGLVQSSRVGDIDPYILPYIMKRKGISLDDALKELSANGGLKGISGVGSDMRDIQEAAAQGNGRARLAIDKFVYDVVRYIGAFHVLLGGVDVLAFSGGIGFNNSAIRKMIIGKIAFLGIDLDERANDTAGEGVKTKLASAITVFIVDTNEEIVVARETMKKIRSR